MPAQEPFSDWLDQFNRDWWKAPQDVSSADLDVPARPSQSASSELASRLERLAEERARLQQRVDELSRENLELKERHAGIETQLAEFNASLSRARQGYEARIAQLETEKGALESRLKSQETFEKAGESLRAENQQLRDDLRLRGEKALEAERAAMELKRRIADLEAQAARLREERAAQEGALTELRRQGDGYQQRLIHAKELTDSDVALLRQEIRLFLEEFKSAAGRFKETK